MKKIHITKHKSHSTYVRIVLHVYTRAELIFNKYSAGSLAHLWTAEGSIDCWRSRSSALPLITAPQVFSDTSQTMENSIRILEQPAPKVKFRYFMVHSFYFSIHFTWPVHNWISSQDLWCCTYAWQKVNYNLQLMNIITYILLELYHILEWLSKAIDARTQNCSWERWENGC